MDYSSHRTIKSIGSLVKKDKHYFVFMKTKSTQKLYILKISTSY